MNYLGGFLSAKNHTTDPKNVVSVTSIINKRPKTVQGIRDSVPTLKLLDYYYVGYSKISSNFSFPSELCNDVNVNVNG